MKKAIMLLMLFALFETAIALPTDGNYILIQHEVMGSGETKTDTNYSSYNNTGEPATSENTSDTNYAMSAGFYAEPTERRTVAEEAAAAVRTYLMMLTEPGNTNFFLGILYFGVVSAGSILYLSKRVKNLEKKRREEEEEIPANVWG